VIFERDEVLTRRHALQRVHALQECLAQEGDAFYLKPYPVARYRRLGAGALPEAWPAVPTLADIGFRTTNLRQLRLPTGPAGGQAAGRLPRPHRPLPRDTRDFPAVKGPSYLSVHLRFGTVSSASWRPREARALQGSAGRRGVAGRADLARLLLPDPGQLSAPDAWPEPQLQARIRRIAWEQGKQADELFKAWCEGRTGYPLVDAAMHQINQTGYMHNRLRMVVASFLCKDLGLDWRWGEPTSRSTSTTSTCPPTTAAGNGRAPAAVMRSPTSASSTP
jgi:deoxyribodipyrimidine photo-lyase